MTLIAIQSLIFRPTDLLIVKPLLSTAVTLPLAQLPVWGKLDKQPATGYLLEQFTMPWQGKTKYKNEIDWDLISTHTHT